MKSSGLYWNQLLNRQLEQRLSQGLKAFNAELVKGAKTKLYPGHGYLTGTLKRSIHAADPDYDWGRDNVEPSGSTPERGSHPYEPVKDGTLLMSAVGSGMRYALPVHQGWGSFEGYHYIIYVFLELQPHAVSIIVRGRR